MDKKAQLKCWAFLFLRVSRPEIGLQVGGLFLEKTIPARIKHAQRYYKLGFKLEVVAAVEKGDITYKEAQKVCGIPGRSTVHIWL